MSQPDNSSVCDDEGADIALGASLLITSKYSRLWRRSFCIGILISLKKPATNPHESPQSSLSSVSYTPLPATPPPAVSEPPSRTSSAKSSCAIDICSDEQCIKNNIARIVKEKDLKSLHELGGVDRVLSVLEDRHSEEANIDNGNHRVLETAEPVHETSFSYFLWNSCRRNSYTILLLLISAGLSLATETKQEGPRYGWHDAVAIVVAVIMLVAFSSVANFWRERKMLKLSKKTDKLKFTVLRGENSLMVAISDIMVGDRVCLQRGDEVPADGLLLSDDNFVLDGALNCNDERSPFLLSGSKVSEGQGRMLVTSVRDKTRSTEMQSSTGYDPEKETLLESRIEKPISCIDNVALLFSVLVALVVLIRLIFKKDGDNNEMPDIKSKVSIAFMIRRIFLIPQGKFSILARALTVAIISMQHAVPLMVTISLKYQIDKMMLNQVADLHDLFACATMGLVTVICIDASGGLMCKLMEVNRIWMGEKEISKDVGSETDQIVLEVLQQGLGVSVLAPEPTLFPVSNSLISWAETTWGMNIESFNQNFTILQHSKLNSVKESSGVLVRKDGDHEQVLHLHWSGAASTILDMCSLYYDSNGECHAMENQKIKFGQMIKDMEDDGLKPIALAYRQTKKLELEQDGLILLALIGLKHTRQEEIKSAFEDLKNAGIKIKLVSRHDIMTVRAIACELGMAVQLEDGVILEAKQLQDLNGTARSEKLDLALVMGSFLPEDKLLLVRCLRDKGHVVAFFGGIVDTASDTAVLKVADVGIVDSSLSSIMGRESSSISIKCFSALNPIVRAGRCTYHNIQKFMQIQLTASISGLLITSITASSTGDSPLTGVQLIWVNMLMCLLGGLMMVMELNTEEQLASQPSDRKQSLITKELWRDIVIHVLYQVSVSMIFQFGGQVRDNTKQVRETMIFNTFMLCQVFNQLKTMQLLKKGVFKIVLQSYCFLVALGVCLLMQVLVIQYAYGLADCVQMNATQWAICILVGALSWLFDWALKFLLVIIRTNCASPYQLVSPACTGSIFLTWPFHF